MMIHAGEADASILSAEVPHETMVQAAIDALNMSLAPKTETTA